MKVKRIWIRTTYFTFQNKTITGTNIPLNTHLSANTIFSQCDVILGDRLISQSSATNLYVALIETLPNFFWRHLEKPVQRRIIFFTKITLS